MQAVGTVLAVADDPEVSLVHAAKNGDLAAFEELVRRYDRKVLRIALHITNNQEDAEDAAQDAFLKAFRALGQFEQKSRFSTWLYRIAVNESLMRVRKRGGIRMLSIDQEESADLLATEREFVNWAPTPEHRYTQSELRTILTKALDSLPPAYRTMFLLRDVEGLSIIETTQVLNLSVSAVKARLMRARLKLRQLLTPYFRASPRPAAGARSLVSVLEAGVIIPGNRGLLEPEG